jgi:LysM repeat protein
LSNVQKLTPEADGRYYHTVHSGETLSWIASFYDVSLSDLMAWNGLDAASVIRPEQKLVLLVAPPATPTFTPGPPTVTPSPSPTLTPLSPTATPIVTATESSAGTGVGLLLGVVVIGIGGFFWWRVRRNR